MFRKRAVLLIHGFVGGIYDFGNLQNELQMDRRFDVFTFTLPGHEKMIVKDVKSKEWIDESEKQIESLIKNGYKRIYVVGHSMGGVIAVHLASKYHEVKKLVLAAPAFRFFCFEDGKVNLKGLNNTLKSMPEVIRDEGHAKVIERIRKTPLSTMLEFTSLVSKYQDDLKRITCPVLTIHGLNDHVVPEGATDMVYDTVLSKVNILANMRGVSHDCFTQNGKEKVKDMVHEFLKHYQFRSKRKIVK